MRVPRLPRHPLPGGCHARPVGGPEGPTPSCLADR